MPQIDLAERMKIIAARINEGKDTYAGRLDAWHLLGNVLGKFTTWKGTLDSAGQAFQVLKFQLEFLGTPIDAWGTFRLDKTIPKGLEGKAKVFNIEGVDHHLTFLAPVGKGYQVIQHTDGFGLLDRLVGQIDGAHYETMGTLDFGRMVWGQVDPNFSIRVGDDVSTVFLTFHTSHDGSLSFDIFETGTREVCRNTFKIGSLKRLAASMKVRHTANAQERIANLTAEIDEIKNVAMTMQERLTYLTTKRVTKESLATIMNRLFPPTKNDDGVEESSGRRDNILAEIMAQYEYNDGGAFPTQAGTPYCLWNSITNYVDHSRSSKGNGNGRAEAAIFGSGDKLKNNALEYIMAEAEGMPYMPTRGASVQVDWEEIGIKLPARSN